MLSARAKKIIGFWRRVLLNSKHSMSASTRNKYANKWLRTGLNHADKAKALHDAAVEMDPTVKGGKQ